MRAWTAGLLVIGLLAPAAARADLCSYDSLGNGTGVPVRWLTMPIKYTVNVSRLPAADQAAALAAVQAAFAAWQLPCTKLQFQYIGPSTAFSGGVKGAILVYWGDDAASWPYGTFAYYRYLEWSSATTGELSGASLGMNARDYLWSVGAKPFHLDIQSVVTAMIPDALGFYAGPDATKKSLALNFNTVSTTLTPEQKQGAESLYFKADPGCNQPAALKPCALWVAPTDGGVKDGGTLPDKSAGLDKAKLDGGAGDKAGSSVDKPAVTADKPGASADKTGSVEKAASPEKGASAADRGFAPERGAGAEAGAASDRGSVEGGGGQPDAARPAPPSSDGGCNCRAAGEAPEGPTWLILFGIGLALAAVRRRSPR